MSHPILDTLAEFLAPLASTLKPEQIKELQVLIEDELDHRPLIHMAWKRQHHIDVGVNDDGTARRDERTYTDTYALGGKNPSDEDAIVFAIFEAGDGVVVYSAKNVQIGEETSAQYWTDRIPKVDGWRGQLSAEAVLNYTAFLLAPEDDEDGGEDPRAGAPALTNGHAQ
jgi:hypothetical protein